MRKEQITPKIIELSKRIAKKWRMEIYEGCWFVDTFDKLPFLHDKTSPKGYAKKYGIPIPSISDVLEKLREATCTKSQYIVDQFKHYIFGNITLQNLHEALLSALAEVLEV